MADQNVMQEAASVCKHHQSGYCKYGDQCHKPHNNEKCREKVCRERKCRKRPPKSCNFFARNNTCKYNEMCAYAHPDKESHTHIEDLEKEVRGLKLDIEKLSKHTAEMADELFIIQSTHKEIHDIKEHITHLRNNMSAMMVKLASIEQEDCTENVLQEQIEEKYFKCEQCDLNSTSYMSLRKHINTKHPINTTQRQYEDEHICYICEEKLNSAWDYMKHQEEHMERKEMLFQCKLCRFSAIKDKDIRNHMIQHIENVLKCPKLTETEQSEKLDTRGESDEDEEYDDDIMSRFDEDGNLLD